MTGKVKSTTCTICGAPRMTKPDGSFLGQALCEEYQREYWRNASSKKAKSAAPSKRKRKAAPAPAEQPRRMVEAVTPLPLFVLAPMTSGVKCKVCDCCYPFDTEHWYMPPYDVRSESGFFWAAFSWTCRNCDGSAVKPESIVAPEQPESVVVAPVLPGGEQTQLALVSANDHTIQRFRATLEPFGEPMELYQENTTKRGAALIDDLRQDGFRVLYTYDMEP